jgi:sulfur relay (sulfurtransferase) complex TusBCD TusD component (DsrE family)
MDHNTVILFTRNGLGSGAEDLQQALAVKFLSLLLESGRLPSKILFYTAGVKLACTGSPVLAQLHRLAELKVELVLCKTCLDYFQLAAQVQVGVVGGMGDILEALQQAEKVVSV